MRILPAVAMLMERYVPASGLRLPDGDLVPPGAIVGLNPWVIHRNPAIWGADVDAYRPERWLRGAGGEEEESEEAYAARMRLWDGCDISFGAGSHVCIGRNLAMLEVYKLVATLVTRYEIELESERTEMTMTGSWFPVFKGLRARLRKRED